jgi:SAM-dependent methyltransferase
MSAMPRTREDHYLQPYRRAHGRFGSDFPVTLWASLSSQQTRFAVMAHMVNFTGKRVLDAGCSRGDFARYLLDHDQPYAQFIGVDALGEVIDHARARPLPRSAFYCEDFVTHPETLAIGAPQVVAISGSLNTMAARTALSVLEAAWEAAGETLIFNFLSDRTGPRAQPQFRPAHRLPTLELLDWAMRKTWAVRFRQDYFDQGHDGTIRMDKPEDA